MSRLWRLRQVQHGYRLLRRNHWADVLVGGHQPVGQPIIDVDQADVSAMISASHVPFRNFKTLCAIPRRKEESLVPLSDGADLVSKKIGHYLNLPDVRKTLGVDKAHGPWSSCDNMVGHNFHASLDQVGKTWLYVSNLLERGVRILNYAGRSPRLALIWL